MRDPNRSGFTLIEILVVTALIAGIMAIAAPQLIPMIATSTHDGAARRVAGYARSTLHYAASADEDIVFVIDLDAQAFWCEGWPEPDDEDDKRDVPRTGREEAEAEAAEDEEPSTMASEFSGDPFGKFLSEGRILDPDTGRALTDASEEELGGSVADVRSQEYWYELSLRVPHNPQGARDLDQEAIERERLVRYDDYGNAIERQVIRDPLLDRVALPFEIAITSVAIGTARQTEGVVEIPVTPFGLESDVEITIQNARGESLLVRWDAVFGRTEVLRGERANG